MQTNNLHWQSSISSAPSARNSTHKAKDRSAEVVSASPTSCCSVHMQLGFYAGGSLVKDDKTTLANAFCVCEYFSLFSSLVVDDDSLNYRVMCCSVILFLKDVIHRLLLQTEASSAS